MIKRFLLGLVIMTTLVVTIFFLVSKSISEIDKVSCKEVLTETAQHEMILSEQVHPIRELNEKIRNHETVVENINRADEIFEKENEADRPDLAQKQDFLRTMNPALGRPTPENLPLIIEDIKNARSILGTPGSNAVPWEERGPKNVAGRTRAIMVDPNDATRKTIWAAGVSGGLWKTTDITATTPNWTPINDLFPNMAITCLAYDSTNNDTMYFGTGEVWTNEDAVKGFGVWRSTNQGVSWNKLSSTAGINFEYVNKIVVHPTNHKVYVATRQGLFVSSNAGNTFTRIGYVGKNISDIVLANNGRVYIGVGGGGSTGTFHYTDNNGSTWDPVAHDFDSLITNAYRVHLAIAPGNNSILYALVGGYNKVIGIFKSVNGGLNWTATAATSWVDQNCSSTAADFSRDQAWYDLAIAVNPNDPNNVIVGGVDLLKTSNGGSSWTQISSWAGACGRQYVHADQHIILYEPGSSGVAYIGNDGGIYRTTNANTSVPSFASRNTNYNVTQFYSCAVNPASGSNMMLAGSQDNGTQRFNTAGINSTTEAISGDGGYCFIDRTNPACQIASYTYNAYYRSLDSGITFTNIANNNSYGLFINPADYDQNKKILYSSKDNYSIYRIKNITTTPTSLQTVSISGMSEYANHIKVSPYTTASTTLFIGDVTGSVYKVVNADTTPTTTNISGTNLPSFVSVSCIEIGANENELLVTFSNYGVNSVWYSANGGTTWVSKEGNLPDMPVRWALFNPANRNEVLLATELGVWATTNFNATYPTWLPSNTGLANVRVDMLRLRQSDTMLFAATHGRGLYSSKGFSAEPIAAFTADVKEPCVNQTVTFADTSALNPSSWYWSVTPATYSFVGGTTANSKNPQLKFNSAGENYTITLTATNSFGTNTISKSNYITTTAITNNTINGTQTICFGTVPTVFNGTVPLGGAGATAVGFKINEDFNGTLVPSGWSLSQNQGNLLKTDNTRNSFGRTGTLGVIKVDNYNVLFDSVARLNTKVFSPTKPQEVLRFDIAHAALATYADSLSIYANTGSGFNRIISWGSKQVVDTIFGITTADALFSNIFVPSASQWVTKTVALPTGTTQIRFEFYSGYGNQMYLDRVRIDSFAYPVSYQWEKSTTSATAGFSALGGSSNTQNYTSSSLTQNSWFRRVVSSGSCTSDTSAAIAVSINNLPTATATAASATTFCQGGSVTIDANTGAGLNYQWRRNGTSISGATSASYTTNSSGAYKVFVTNASGCIDSSNTVNVTVNSLPAANITPSGITTFCQGGTVTLNANTGAGLSYQWKKNASIINGAVSSSLLVGTSGSYYVIVTNGSGCIDSSSAVSVTVNALPTAIATPSSATTFCLGDQVIINANIGIGLSYQWRKNNQPITGATASSYTANTSGAYKVVVNNGNGCIDSSNTVNVVVHPLTQVSISATGVTTFCEGGQVTLNANVVTGLTYQWRKNGTNISGASASSYTVTNSGSYKVIVSNANNCVDSSGSIAVTVNALPIAQLNAVGVTTLCQGSSVMLKATTGPGYNYKWKRNDTIMVGVSDSFYVASSTGNYKVIITNGNGCSDSSNSLAVLVNPLPAALLTATGNTTFCFGDSVVLKASSGAGLSYVWRRNGAFLSGAADSIFTAKVTGSYKVIITNANGCVDSSNAIAIVVNALPLATTSIVGATTVCEGERVEIVAAPGAGHIYQWKKNGVLIGGAVNDTFYATSSGSYKVIVMNGSACMDSSVAINVVVNALPLTNISITGDTTFCEGDSVRLKANTGVGFSYQWIRNGNIITGANDSILVAKASGIYKVKIANINACNDTSRTISVTANPLPTAPVITRSGFLLTTTAVANKYEWLRNDSVISGAAAINYNVTINGNYKLKVSDANGCSSYSNIIAITNVGIKVGHANNVFSVYPNPASTMLTVRIAGVNGAPVTFCIINSIGEVVYANELTETLTNIDVSSFAAGVYLIRAGEFMQHFVKQ